MGTVPRVSATPLDREQDLREIFFAERHASLQRNDHVLTDLVERLKQMQAPRHRPARGGIAVAPRTMGLRIEQLYLTTEPVELSVEAEDIEPFGAPRARIVGTASELPEREARFVRSGDRWTANFGTLPPGQYRVRVEPGRGGPGAPSPVHDVFEVAT